MFHIISLNFTLKVLFSKYKNSLLFEFITKHLPENIIFMKTMFVVKKNLNRGLMSVKGDEMKMQFNDISLCKYYFSNSKTNKQSAEKYFISLKKILF
jgi:hypothetical protein